MCSRQCAERSRERGLTPAPGATCQLNAGCRGVNTSLKCATFENCFGSEIFWVDLKDVEVVGDWEGGGGVAHHHGRPTGHHTKGEEGQEE